MRSPSADRWRRTDRKWPTRATSRWPAARGCSPDRPAGLKAKARRRRRRSKAAMKKLIFATAIAATAIVPALIAQQRQGGQDPTGANPPSASTSPAGAGGLNTGRGRGPQAPQGPAPKLADGRPDFSGVWQGGGPVGDLAQGMPKGVEIPLSEAGKKLMASRQSKDDPEANCLPTGVPRQAPYPWRIVQT